MSMFHMMNMRLKSFVVESELLFHEFLSTTDITYRIHGRCSL